MWPRQKFWSTNGGGELATIGPFLRRRFPDAFELLSRALEEGDPQFVVHPNQPDEYEDVVWEMLVMADRVDGDFSLLTRSEVEEMVREAIGRCFESRVPTDSGDVGEEDDDEDDEDDEQALLEEERLQLVVDLICERAAHGGGGVT